MLLICVFLQLAFPRNLLAWVVIGDCVVHSKIVMTVKLCTSKNDKVLSCLFYRHLSIATGINEFQTHVTWEIHLVERWRVPLCPASDKTGMTSLLSPALQK